MMGVVSFDQDDPLLKFFSDGFGVGFTDGDTLDPPSE